MLLVIVTDTTIVNVAAPTLADKLHAGSSALEWIVDAYTLAFAALLLPAGAIGDRYGRHRALAVDLLIPASKAPRMPRFDPPGTVLGVAASTGLTYTAIEAGLAGRVGDY